MMPVIKHLLRAKPLFFLALLYSIFISVLFFIPSSGFPKVKIPIYGLDKIVHGVIHFILINVWMLYLYVKNDFQFRVKWVFLLFLSLMLFGIIVEVLQDQLTDSRGADIFDVVANLTGSLLGILFFKILIKNLNFKNFI